MLSLFSSLVTFSVVLLSLVFFWFFWKTRSLFSLNREKASPFECGFDPKDSARLPFSVRFFFLMILFIMFDVELALILHLPFMFKQFFFFSRISLLVIFWVLFLGLLDEWRRGIMSWKSLQKGVYT